jgi:4-hydroxy-tetrahydrodipicolinate synthase
MYALRDEEKKRVIEVTVDQANGKVPVYVGTGDVTTEKVIELTKHAEDAGADAASIVTPYFIRPSRDELYTHYKKVAEAVNIPVILYNNPGRTGINLDASTVSSLAEIDNIRGVKDSGGDLTLTAEYVRQVPGDFSVMAGKDSLILATLVYGGKGAIAATANVAPRLVLEIYNSFVNHDLEGARRAQFKLLPLRMAFDLGTFPAVIKEAMTLIGKPGGPAKSPVGPLSKENMGRLKAILQDLEVDGLSRDEPGKA